MEGARVTLSDREVDRTLSGVHGWRREGDQLVRELKPVDIGDFQKFVDFAVAKGMLSGPFDVRTMLKPL